MTNEIKRLKLRHLQAHKALAERLEDTSLQDLMKYTAKLDTAEQRITRMYKKLGLTDREIEKYIYALYIPAHRIDHEIKRLQSPA